MRHMFHSKDVWFKLSPRTNSWNCKKPTLGAVVGRLSNRLRLVSSSQPHELWVPLVCVDWFRLDSSSSMEYLLKRGIPCSRPFGIEKLFKWVPQKAAWLMRRFGLLRRFSGNSGMIRDSDSVINIFFMGMFKFFCVMYEFLRRHFH